jgi:hypothetical protein
MKLRLAMAAVIVALMVFAAPGRALADETPATAPAAPASPAATPPATPVTEPAPATGKRTLWPWIIMGTGVALIVTATVLEVNAVHEDDQRESEEVKLKDLVSLPASDPKKAQLQASVDDHAQSASSERTAALIVGTVGFLTVAGSVVLWFVEGSAAAPAAPAAKRRPTFTPSFGPSYAGATLGASF